jgi:hypothetical protein
MAKLCLTDKDYEVVDRTYLAEDKNLWFAAVKMVMHLRIP